MLKQLGPATTIEEKFNILLKKFIETEKTCKKLNSTIKLSEKKFDLLSREKDILQKEYNKGVLMKYVIINFLKVTYFVRKKEKRKSNNSSILGIN